MSNFIASDIHIAFGVSQDWLVYTRVTIASILANASKKDNYHFYLLSNSFSDEDKVAFYNLNKIKTASFDFIVVNDSDFEGAINDWLGISASYRLKLPDVLNIEKVLYLDSDITVVKDIAELYNYDISDYYLAAVEDKCSPMMCPRVDFKENESFINSGVLLLNLIKWREENITSKIIDKNRESSFFTDQDGINYICKEKILKIPIKYNLMVPISAYDPPFEHKIQEAFMAFDDAIVYHHIIKPWNEKVDTISEKWAEYEELANKCNYC